MQDLRTIDIPKIIEDEVFENLCRDLWKNDHKYEFIELNGRKGQKQSGVDIFGRVKQSTNWFGIQCKVRSKGKKLTQEDIENEIQKAQTFNPKLTKFIICTTLDRDVEIQNIERQIQDNLSNLNGFEFKIIFWDNIKELLKEERNLKIYYKYYNKFFADNTTFGHVIGKLLTLQLGVGDNLETRYEIIIGKIPNFKYSDDTSASYYRGTYFIINLSERSMETFRETCFESDIDKAFENTFDRFRIVHWIRSLKNIDDFIYSDEISVDHYISEEDRKSFLQNQIEI